MANKSRTYLVPLLYKVYGSDISLSKIYDCFALVKDYPEHVALVVDSIWNTNTIPVSTEQQISDSKKVIVVPIPNELVDDYHYFLKGKYSLIKKANKDSISNYLFKNVPISQHKVVVEVAKVLFKHPELRKRLEQDLDVVLDDDAELSSIIDSKEETFQLKS